MSEYERNKGILKPIEGEYDLENPPEGILNIFGKTYQVEFEIERETNYLEFVDVKTDDQGNIEFHTLHYNGGGSLEEVIEDGLK